MKAVDFITGIVFVADQRASRRNRDAVPEALSVLQALPPGVLLPFERTTGDELQGLLTAPEPAVRAVVLLTRMRCWRLGIGIGRVDAPLPASTRTARGPAYLAARSAIEDARSAPTGLRVLPGVGSAQRPRGQGVVDDPAVRELEACLWLLQALLLRRSAEGWQLADLLDEGLSNRDAALRLGVSASAVSQRLRRSAKLETDRGEELATRLFARAITEVMSQHPVE